jgi:chromosome segregation ATPase
MSDTNAFVNAYIDHAVGMIHENVSAILQLKAQLKIANDLIAEKDAAIGSLAAQLESSKINTDEMSVLRDQARHWEDKHNSMVGRISHLDTALSQIAQMKKEILDRDEQIAKLQEKLNPTKKTINTKKSKVVTIIEHDGRITLEKPATDDF